jgi:hypothetical protein
MFIGSVMAGHRNRYMTGEVGLRDGAGIKPAGHLSLPNLKPLIASFPLAHPGQPMGTLRYLAKTIAGGESIGLTVSWSHFSRQAETCNLIPF